ncbi:helix-turn-helix domain-containing protein, partial [Nostoc sp. UIC 10890]
MTIVLYDQDWYEMLNENQTNHQFSSNSDIYEESTEVNTKYFHWQEWYMPLRSGLHIRTYEIQPIDNFIKIAEHGNYDLTTLSFFIRGNTKTFLQNLANSADEVVGHNYLEFLPDIKESDEYEAGQKVLRLQIWIDLAKFFSEFDANQLQYLPCELQKVAAGTSLPAHYRQGITTPEMQLALQQILNCPFQGLMKRLYLEAKAIELMMLQFSQFVEPVSPAKSEISLALDDVERIYQAKEIIIHSLKNPPSLLELSRQVKLNDYKLKQGFRQVFGKTVFGYLHDYRMQQAYMLLARGQAKVQEVAQAVG